MTQNGAVGQVRGGDLHSPRHVQNRSIKSGTRSRSTPAGRRARPTKAPTSTARAPTTTRSTRSTTRRARRSRTGARSPGWGEHGFHYKDSTGALKERDGKLIDRPRLSGSATDARQIFETTAIATKGAQAGTYYGSVRWGWRTDERHLHEAPAVQGLRRCALLDVPEVGRAVEREQESSTGANTVDLPVPDVKVTTGPVTLKPTAADDRHRRCRSARASRSSRTSSGRCWRAGSRWSTARTPA